MFSVRTVAGSSPVSLAEAKAQLAHTLSDDDTLVQRYIDTATATVEEMSGRYIASQTWRHSMWPATGSQDVYLPFPPVISVSSVTYLDADEVEQTLAPTEYRLRGDQDAAILSPATAWPTMAYCDDAFRVSLVHGYAATPPNLKQAILQLVNHWFENRGAESEAQMTSIPYSVESMVALSRSGWAKG